MTHASLFHAYAVLYVCAPTEVERYQHTCMGLRFAEERAFEIVETITESTDDYRNAEPDQRPGWQLLLSRADTWKYMRLITRWPASISTDVVRRYSAIAALADRGVQAPLYSWPVQELHGRPRMAAP